MGMNVDLVHDVVPGEYECIEDFVYYYALYRQNLHYFLGRYLYTYVNKNQIWIETMYLKCNFK
jgi:hypothetical protein